MKQLNVLILDDERKIADKVVLYFLSDVGTQQRPPIIQTRLLK